jgi:beta-lactamase regulating signal transducer with metallopeptidase domain
MALFSFIHPIHYALAWTVIHAIWQILVIALGSAVVLAIMRNYKAAIRYNILLASIGSIVILSLATFIYYFTQAPNTLFVQEQENIINLVNNSPSATATNSTNNNSFSISNIQTYVNVHIYTIVLIWIIGVVLAILRLLGSVSYVHYLKNNMNFSVDDYWQHTLNALMSKLNIKKNIEILESALVRSPIVIGHIKPLILFPIGAINRLSVPEVESILAHELAHISRNDYLINILVNVVESLYYFHPAMWWLASQIKTEREHCCDDIAIAQTGDPLNYAKSLVAVQEMAMYSPHLAMAFAGGEKKNELLMRVNRIINQSSKSFNMKEKSISTLIVCTILAITFIAARPSENTAACLPVRGEGNPMFLKYPYKNNIDSLEIDFPINDGVYNFNDYLHQITMKVEKKHVVSFNLNGLEIVGSDISKFENLINQILVENTSPIDMPYTADNAHKPSTPEYDVDVAAAQHDEEMAHHDMELIENQALHDHFMEQLQKDKVLKPKGFNSVIFNASFIEVNGKKLTANQHKVYVSIFEKTSRKKMNSKTQFSFNCTIDENGTLLTENVNGSTPHSTYTHSAISHSSTTNSQGSNLGNPPTPPMPPSTKSTSNSFSKWLENELIKDGYITDPHHYNISWMSQMMMVNENVIPASYINKYEAKMKELTGNKVDKNFQYTVNVNKD